MGFLLLFDVFVGKTVRFDHEKWRCCRFHLRWCFKGSKVRKGLVGVLVSRGPSKCHNLKDDTLTEATIKTSKIINKSPCLWVLKNSLLFLCSSNHILRGEMFIWIHETEVVDTPLEGPVKGPSGAVVR